MNKESIIKLIQESKVSEDLKSELLGLVGDDEPSPEMIQKIQARLEQAAEEKIEEVANKVAENAADTFTQDVDQLEQEENKIAQEISKKADEIDLEETRKQI
ncbi:MAG: hypothetical protein PHW01_03450 [Patescibacteria group bacterium]|nr:hypothetical protein [Patescibacteria group bacterium]